MMEKARTNPKIVERGPKQRDERESGKTSDGKTTDNDHFIWSVVGNCYCRGCAVCMLDTFGRDSRVCFAFAVLGEYLYTYCILYDGRCLCGVVVVLLRRSVRWRSFVRFSVLILDFRSKSHTTYRDKSKSR